MNEQNAVEVPRFELPRYGHFVRHVWQYRDDRGESVVFPPPAMFTLYHDDEGELAVLKEIYDLLMSLKPEWSGRISGAGYLAFADLQVLYGYLSLLCRAARTGDVRAQQLGEYVMWVLGFRWVNGHGPNAS